VDFVSAFILRRYKGSTAPWPDSHGGSMLIINQMKLGQQLLHSVNDSGMIKSSKKVMDDAGLVPGRRIEIIVETGLLKIHSIT
jgi:hypothetical protein